LYTKRLRLFSHKASTQPLGIGGTQFAARSAMEERKQAPEAAQQNVDSTGNEANLNQVIPVMQENVMVGKRVVETGKVHISKKVTEDQTTVSLPLAREEYDVERVPINKVVDTPPPAMRQEGDTAIIPVLREVMVVQKHYEIVEEIRITKRRTETTDTQQVTLRKEEVQIERSDLHPNNDAAR
jgi:uncharacterized protein (TIGR02271 family)